MTDSLNMLMMHFNFSSGFPVDGSMMEVSYDYSLVIISYLISCIAGYIGLSLSQVVKKKQVLEENVKVLLFLGSLSMGAGIWAMHFIAMLAYSIEVEISYDVFLTAVSVIPAIFASWVSLKAMLREGLSLPCYIKQGVIIGLGIGVMHYIGMGAMIQEATPYYHTGLFVLSIFVAGTLGSITLYIRFSKLLENHLSKTSFNFLSASLWGAAVSGMHYTGMASVFFTPGGMPAMTGGIPTESLILPVSVVSILIVVSALVFIEFQHRISLLALKANENREKLVEAIEGINDGFIISNENNIVTMFNQQIQTILPGSEEYLKIGSTLDSFLVWMSKQIHTDEKEDIEREQMVRCMLSIASCQNSMEILFNDGRWIMLRQSQTKSGSVMRLWSDITAYKKADEAIYQEEKMESMGRMVAGVAHEVNTPLGVCLSLSSQLDEQTRTLRNIYENNEVTQKQFEEFLETTESISEIMLSNIRRAADLIRNFKQVAVDQSHLELDKIQIKKYTSQVINTLRSEYKALNPDIEISGPDELEITTVPGAYAQVIINLIKNSVVHAFQDIEKPKMMIQINTVDDFVSIIYQDNGVGMPKNVLEKIFDPFFTTKRNKGGTGLGMHIVYNLVNQKLKGNINVESEPNNGSKFTIMLPSELVVA